MALPTTLNPSTKVNSTGTGVSPAEPTGVADGDLEILVASTIAGGSISITNNGGSAWAALGTGSQDVTGGEKLYVWYRIRQAGDGAPTVTPGGDHICATMYGYHNVDGTTPIEAVAWSSETTSDSTYSYAPGNSTGGADRKVCTIYSSGADSNTGQGGTVTNANLASVTMLAEYQTNNGGGGGFVIGEGNLAVGGAIGTWGDNAMVTATPKAYVSFAVRPLVGVAYTETAIIPSITSPSSEEIYGHEYLDALTTAGKTEPSSVEVYDVTESATVSGATTITSDELSDLVDSSEIPGTTSLEAVEVIDYLETATCAGLTEVSAAEEYTPSTPNQVGVPIADVTSIGWTPSTGTTLYECIDEASYDDNDYIYATAT